MIPLANGTMYHFEFWVSPAQCERVSIVAQSYEVALQTVIGRYAPTFVRELKQS